MLRTRHAFWRTTPQGCSRCVIPLQRHGLTPRRVLPPRSFSGTCCCGVMPAGVGGDRTTCGNRTTTWRARGAGMLQAIHIHAMEEDRPMTTQRDAGKGTGEARRPDMAGLRTAVHQVFAAASPAGGPDVLGIEVLDVLGGTCRTGCVSLPRCVHPLPTPSCACRCTSR